MCRTEIIGSTHKDSYAKHSCGFLRLFAVAVVCGLAAIIFSTVSVWGATGDENWSSSFSKRGFDGSIYAVAVGSSGEIYAGGQFTFADGTLANNIAKWNGSSWSALGSGMDGTVKSLSFSGGALYAAGEFHKAGGVAAEHVAKWDGSSWSALGSGTDDAVYAIAASGSDVYAGGKFTTAGGVSASRVAKWNGSSWLNMGSGINGGLSTNGIANAIAISGSDVYVGGSFTTAGGMAVNNIAKWNGSSWSALGSGVSGGYYHNVKTIAISGSNVYVSGNFNTAGGVAVNNIAKWNGSSWSALGNGINGSVDTIAVNGDDIYAGGYFYGYGDSIYIVKWNGSSWSALKQSLFTYSNYSFAICGSDLICGTNYYGVIKYNISRSFCSKIESRYNNGLDGPVKSITICGMDVYVGGECWCAGSQENLILYGLAKWNNYCWSSLYNIPYAIPSADEKPAFF